MALTPDERRRIVDAMDQLDNVMRERALSSFDSFVDWISNKLGQIYQRVKDGLVGMWNRIRSIFGF